MATTPQDLVQGQFDAYNAQDVDAFCAFFSDDICLTNYLGDVTTSGIGAVRQKHIDLFGTFPGNKATLINRIVVGSTVFDHEHVSRGPGGDEFEVACIYTISNGRISRVDYVKAGQS